MAAADPSPSSLPPKKEVLEQLLPLETSDFYFM